MLKLHCETQSKSGSKQQTESIMCHMAAQ